MKQTNVSPIRKRQESFVVENFTDLEKALQEDAAISGYQFDDSVENVITLYKDGLTKIFLSSTVWQSSEKKAPFIKNLGAAGTTVIFVGTTVEFDSLKEDENIPQIQHICIPTSSSNLQMYVKNIHKLQSLVDEIHTEKELVRQASEEVKYVLSISRQLNGERDIPKLLNLILLKAREITKADAGSIYTVETKKSDNDQRALRFQFTQNDSITQNLSEFELPINEDSVVGNAVIHQETINIPDLYSLPDDNSKNKYNVKHDRSWDRRLGYESHSMMTVPMFDISHNVVGVIQLINRKITSGKKLVTQEDFQNEIVPFDETDTEYAEIVAQQAGIALENAKMHDDIQNLFDGFVDASVTAIEQRDPTTSGHSHRVAHFTIELAEIVSRVDSGKFAKIIFNDDQIKEIKYASLLHDFGKLGVRENVLVKAKKLYSWQYDLLKERFELIRATYEIEYLRNCVNLMQNPSAFPVGINLDLFKIERDKKIAQLINYFEFIEKSNEPTVLKEGSFELLKDIANSTFNDSKIKERPFLLQDELKALSVSKGSLTDEEFSEIQSHVTHTYNFLKKIPWGSRLKNVPEIAAQHHEKLDGTGYPRKKIATAIPIQSQMMTIADIFDALTASDRPYKKALPVERALDIIGMEVKDGKIDSQLFQLFLEAEVYKKPLLTQ